MENGLNLVSDVTKDNLKKETSLFLDRNYILYTHLAPYSCNDLVVICWYNRDGSSTVREKHSRTVMKVRILQFSRLEEFDESCKKLFNKL